MTQPPPDPATAALSALLRSWEVDPSMPPRFAEGVWRRIEAAKRPAEAPVFVLLRQALASCLRQPRIAFAYLAAVLLLGAGAGAWRGHSSSAALAEGLQGRYVQSIDPFAAHLR